MVSLIYQIILHILIICKHVQDAAKLYTIQFLHIAIVFSSLLFMYSFDSFSSSCDLTVNTCIGQLLSNLSLSFQN